MSAQISLEVQTNLDELERITSAVEQLAEQENWPPPLVFHVTLALEELAVNVINYGSPDGNHKIEIRMASEEDALTIDIIDDGLPFNPLTEGPSVDVNAPIEERRIGGLGIHLVRSMMDDLSYRRENGKNHLTLAKRFEEQ